MLAPHCRRPSNAAMGGLTRDILAVIVVAAALFALAWFTQPIDQPPLRTVQNCGEIIRLANQKGRILTPAEKTDLANCSTP